MVQRREVQGPSLKTDLPKLGLVVAQHRRLPSWSQVVWDNFLAYFTPKRVWDGIKTSTLQHHARQLFVKSDVFANPANERGKQIQNMSSHLRLAWEVPLLLHEHCQDGQPEHIFFPTGITTFQQFANPVYTKILWWCLLLISRICKRGWNTCQQKRKHRSIYQGRTWAEQQSQYKCQSDFHTKWAMSSRLEVRLSWERCSSPTDTHGEQGLWHSQRLG